MFYFKKNCLSCVVWGDCRSPAIVGAGCARLRHPCSPDLFWEDVS